MLFQFSHNYGSITLGKNGQVKVEWENRGLFAAVFGIKQRVYKIQLTALIFLPNRIEQTRYIYLGTVLRVAKSLIQCGSQQQCLEVAVITRLSHRLTI